MALSASAIQEFMDEDVAPPRPCFKTASNLDFFRSEPGERHCPFVLDDADFPQLKPDSLKAFCDSSAEDVKAMARWNAASFEQFQPRLLCANIFDKAIEPPAASNKCVLTHDEFVKLLGGLFNPAMQLEDILAVFKRCNIIVLGYNFCYRRIASPDTDL
eukprot:3307645-Amphidinium_carterae.1